MSNESPPVFKLNNGIEMPSIGLGCWMGEPGGGEKAEQMVRDAITSGYRKFDTAFGYGNEEAVGKAIRESGIPRKDLFVTTKLASSYHHNVEAGFKQSFDKLNIEYIDLYLMHWPQAKLEDGRVPKPDESPTFVETWLAMETLLKTGKVKSIGISNFSIKNLEVLLPKINVVPVVNQVELHPCLPQPALKDYCQSKGILLEAYCPLGQYNSPLFKEPTIVDIAERHQCAPAQVILSWAVQRGTAVVPKSSNPERMKQNLKYVSLPQCEFDAVSEIHKKPGMHRSLDALVNYQYDWNKHEAASGLVFGWNYEQLGWSFNSNGSVKE